MTVETISGIVLSFIVGAIVAQLLNNRKIKRLKANQWQNTEVEVDGKPVMLKYVHLPDDKTAGERLWEEASKEEKG